MAVYIAAVGNGSVSPTRSYEIDNACYVMRFNYPKHDPHHAGSKTSALCALNSAHHMGIWLKDKEYVKSYYFMNTPHVILPYHPNAMKKVLRPIGIGRWLKGRRLHWTFDAIEEFLRQGKSIEVLPEHTVLECYSVLGLPIEPQVQAPSTGFIGVYHLLKVFPETEIRLYGFSWEGWAGHLWERERRWMASHPRLYPVQD
ncbi:hypothetical protein JDN40_05470 [Rhodomicrobium vannielii ATCC 17100]|uniref:hypothetical protein n=1 Tax=Rhodomicrobium vannielii TaxID=1069 RepID=UPI00191AE6B0|nr:hypothetical protein [Rhodomicrobium vannielii]MBJ7533553.1 hypothetical protein [Rhodomicrobium vannielii ATCC 17100]